MIEVAQGLNGALKLYFVLKHPSEEDVVGETYQSQGRITTDLLKRLLPFDDYDFYLCFYLCVPGPMTQALYNGLRGLNEADERIHAEAFGPASLRRSADRGSSASGEPAEGEVQVTFEASGTSAVWRPGAGSLLDLAGAQELTLPFGCRVGACGSCAARVAEGEVAYVAAPAAKAAPDTALLCCAVPRRETGELIIEV